MTPQQHAFVNEYLSTNNATAAAIAAGYSAKTAQAQSSRLLKQPDIKKAIDAAQAIARDDAQLEVKDLISELEEARQEALANGQCGAAVSATMGKAKLLGLDKQTIEHSSKNGAPLQPPIFNIIGVKPQ